MLSSIWIGFDPRESAAFAVARNSTLRHLSGRSIPVRGLVLHDLIEQGLYTRPIEMRPSAADPPIMWDVISDAAMSTEHANARFLVPHLARKMARVQFKALNESATRFLSRGVGWALFMDGDMLVRADICAAARSLDPSKAVYCVHHNHVPKSATKMDGQIQTAYSRKNWSSFVFFNCDHPANQEITPELVNTLPGRDLHRFCWLDNNEIGELSPEWNFLVGHTDPAITPKVVHFTDGVPDMTGFENVPFADEWRAELLNWAA